MSSPIGIDHQYDIFIHHHQQKKKSLYVILRNCKNMIILLNQYINIELEIISSYVLLEPCTIKLVENLSKCQCVEMSYICRDILYISRGKWIPLEFSFKFNLFFLSTGYLSNFLLTSIFFSSPLGPLVDTIKTSIMTRA